MGISFACAGDCGAAIANASKAEVRIGIIWTSEYRRAEGRQFPNEKNRRHNTDLCGSPARAVSAAAQFDLQAMLSVRFVRYLPGLYHSETAAPPLLFMISVSKTLVFMTLRDVSPRKHLKEHIVTHRNQKQRSYSRLDGTTALYA